MTPHPELSVLIVTHSKPQLCAQLVLSLAMAKDTPPSTEVLVYQSGNPLGHPVGYTQEVIRHALDVHGLVSRFSRVVVIDDPQNCGVAIGMNGLMALARGEYISCFNDDLIVNVHGWYAPLYEKLTSDIKIGMVCGHLVNGGRPYSTIPMAGEMRSNIMDFSDGYRSSPASLEDFQEGASNQPWIFRKQHVWRWIRSDPIVNQTSFLDEWIDPLGPGWYVDWDLSKRIKLAGHRVGVVPQSVLYHYDHVTVRDLDRSNPRWTDTSTDRHSAKWGTSEKELAPGQRGSAAYLWCGALVPYSEESL